MSQPTPRSTPSSPEAEEYLLSCIFLDGSFSMGRALEAGIDDTHFFSTANRLVWEHCRKAYDKHGEVAIDVVAMSLKDSGDLERVGGMPYLLQVSARIPTTAQLPVFIQRLCDLHAVRTIITQATSAVERAYQAQDTEQIQDIVERLRSIEVGQHTGDTIPSIADFEVPPPPEEDPTNLLGDRYVCRGHACITVSGAGMGKSSWAIQESIHYALGRHFMGIRCYRPLVSLHIQAEDEEGEMAIMFHSAVAGMGLTPEEIALVRQRVFVISEKIARGEHFLAKLAGWCAKIKPDLVWLNPLHAYMAGDIKDAEAIGAFCREGLNGVNRKNQWAYMVIHHTTKPMANKDARPREWNEVMYDMAGSADLINWARSVRILKAKKEEGAFTMYLAKRGKEAGAVKQNDDYSFEPTTQIPLQHTTKTITLPGRKKASRMVWWEYRDEDDEVADQAKKSEPKATKRNFDFGELAWCFPASKEPGETINAIFPRARDLTDISRATFYRARADMMEAGLISCQSGLYRRTKDGDRECDDYLRKQK